MSTAIRLVRCPRCREVLPELPNIPLYKCGGCGTTLEAKKHRDDNKGNGSRAQETDPKHEPNTSVSSLESDLPSIESSPGSDGRGEKIESGIYTSEKPVDTNLVEERSHSTEPDYETTRSPESEPLKSIVTNEHQNVGNEIGKLANDLEDPEGEFSQEGKRSNESQRRHLDEPLGPEEDEKVTDGRGSLTRSNDKFFMESHEVGPSSHRMSSEEMSDTSPRIPIAPLSPDDEYLKESREVGPSFLRMSSEEERSDASPSSPRFPIAPLSPDDEYLKEPREVDPGPSFHRISSEEEKLDSLPIHPRFPIAPPSLDHIYVNEENLDIINPRFPIAPLSPDDTFLEESHEVGPIFHRISSEGMFDTSPINPRIPIGLMSKSPTKVYYAGDESESVYDGTEELSAKVSHLYRRKLKEVGTIGTNRSRQNDGFKVKNKQNGELQLHNERLDFFSKFKEPHKFFGAERDWTSHESLEPIKRNRPVRNSTIAANNEPVYMPRSSQLFHRNGTRNVLMNNGDFHPPDTLIGSDPEKNELLRMVYDLEDKINRSHMSGERSPFRSVGEEMRTGGYYDNPATGRNPNYSGHQRSHPQGVGGVNRPRSSKLAFSGEASLCRNHIDCRCSHCYHQDLHYSKKLSSHCIHCQHAAHPRHDYDNIYRSYSPSPQHYTSSEFSHEIQADNQKQDHEMRMLRLREKNQLKKRHLRPVSGAAPIISCYHCSELLQLPADFLLFRKRCHHLRCNSCSKILKFSFLKESNLVPYVIKIQAPPPSEMDGSSNIVDSRTVASTSRANNSQDARPVSFSEDFEPSFSRNGSTESGPSVPSSFSVPKNLSNDKPSSNHPFQAVNDRKMRTVMDIYQDNNKSANYNIEAAGPSSSTSQWVKPSSEIEELPATSCPPLHRLMGYESPRQVLFARSDDDSDDGMGYYMGQQIR